MPENSNSFDNSTKFAAKEIREALKSIEPMLGRPRVEALIEELENLGLQIKHDRKSYNLAEIQSAIEKIFGEATRLFIDRIKNALLEGSK